MEWLIGYTILASHISFYSDCLIIEELTICPEFEYIELGPLHHRTFRSSL